MVPLTLNSEDTAGSAAPKILDLDVLADLEQICKDVKEFTDVIKSFETEADTLMVRIDKAVNAQCYETLAEIVQAMKGIAANVGAVQMVRVCDDLLGLAPLMADARAAALAEKLREVYLTRRNALSELIGSSQLSHG